jgi:hypothetical protein
MAVAWLPNRVTKRQQHGDQNSGSSKVTRPGLQRGSSKVITPGLHSGSTTDDHDKQAVAGTDLEHRRAKTSSQHQWWQSKGDLSQVQSKLHNKDIAGC